MRPGEPALEAVFFKVLLVLKAWTLTLNVEIGLSKSRVFFFFGLLTRACGLKCRGADRFRLDPCQDAAVPPVKLGKGETQVRNELLR